MRYPLCRDIPDIGRVAGGFDRRLMQRRVLRGVDRRIVGRVDSLVILVRDHQDRGVGIGGYRVGKPVATHGTASTPVPGEPDLHLVTHPAAGNGPPALNVVDLVLIAVPFTA